MSPKLVVAAFAALVLLPASPEKASAQEAFIGEIRLFPYTFCPRNWLEANGQLLDISTNNAFFALIGCEYGGDCRTTFAVPKIAPPTTVTPEGDVTSKTPLRYCINSVGLFPSRP